VAHVPLEQRSTARLLLGLVGTAILPIAAALAVILYCVFRFTNVFTDFVVHLPF
jgi:hypothetical protein